MNTKTFRLPALAISALALAVAGCGGSSGGGGILGSAKSAANLGDHEEVLARAILALATAPQFQYAAMEISYDTQEVIYEYGPESEPPASNTEDCLGNDGGSGSVTVALDTLSEVPDLVPEGALPDGPVELDQAVVSFANCQFVDIDEEDGETDTETLTGSVELVTTGEFGFGERSIEGPGVIEGPGPSLRFVGATNLTETDTSEYEDGDREEYRSSTNAAAVSGYQLISEYEDLIGTLELSSEFNTVEDGGDYREEGESALVLLPVNGNPSELSFSEAGLVSGHFRMGVDSTASYSTPEESGSEECQLPGAFTVEVTTPISYDTEGDYPYEPIDGEMTLSSGNQNALVSISGSIVTITIDGVGESFDAEDSGPGSAAFQAAEDKVYSCTEGGGRRIG